MEGWAWCVDPGTCSCLCLGSVPLCGASANSACLEGLVVVVGSVFGDCTAVSDGELTDVLAVEDTLVTEWWSVESLVGSWTNVMTECGDWCPDAWSAVEVVLVDCGCECETSVRGSIAAESMLVTVAWCGSLHCEGSAASGAWLGGVVVIVSLVSVFGDASCVSDGCLSVCTVVTVDRGDVDFLVIGLCSSEADC